MAFTGLATYDPGAEPGYEIHESLSDVVSLIATVETPLLDILGDAMNAVGSPHFDWDDDENVLPRTLSTASATSAATAISITAGEEVDFLAGDILIVQLISTTAASSDYTEERLLVTGTATNTLQVTRGYGGSTAATVPSGAEIACVGRAALEGADARDMVLANYARGTNWCQIFDQTINISGTKEASRNVGGGSRLERETAKKVRFLLAMLEAAVINGDLPASTPQGSSTVRRTTRGIIDFLTGGVIDGSGFTSAALLKAGFELALRTAWDNGAQNVDLAVMNGYQMSTMASNISKTAVPMQETALVQAIKTYTSDFGIQRFVLSRRVPRDTILLLDSSKIEVPPMTKRSFQAYDLAKTGDAFKRQIIGEYGVIVRNATKGHAMINKLPFTL